MAEQTPKTDATALDAATNVILDRVGGPGTSEALVQVQREWWRTTLAAALPHLTGPLEAEVARLHAENEQLRADLAGALEIQASQMDSRASMLSPTRDHKQAADLREAAAGFRARVAVLRETPAPTTEEPQ